MLDIYAKNRNKTLRNGILAMQWFFFSISISLFNKAVIGKEMYNFNFPLALLFVHYSFHYLISFLVLTLYPRELHTMTKPTWTQMMRVIVPTG
jgi:hypothetical protein